MPSTRPPARIAAGATRRPTSTPTHPPSGSRGHRATAFGPARVHRHPLADWFRSVPMGTGRPGMQMPPEAAHLRAIHVFDNL
ncbi:hypothetical protein, partial [Nocardia abscessus]|uniref:hypothetical protein n=1 Tax=Nocardia abscessus TaxID=120957 RepID=UPI002456EE03